MMIGRILHLFSYLLHLRCTGISPELIERTKEMRKAYDSLATNQEYAGTMAKFRWFYYHYYWLRKRKPRVLNFLQSSVCKTPYNTYNSDCLIKPMDSDLNSCQISKATIWFDQTTVLPIEDELKHLAEIRDYMKQCTGGYSRLVYLASDALDNFLAHVAELTNTQAGINRPRYTPPSALHKHQQGFGLALLDEQPAKAWLLEVSQSIWNDVATTALVQLTSFFLHLYIYEVNQYIGVKMQLNKLHRNYNRWLVHMHAKVLDNKSMSKYLKAWHIANMLQNAQAMRAIEIDYAAVKTLFENDRAITAVLRIFKRIVR